MNNFNEDIIRLERRVLTAIHANDIATLVNIHLMIPYFKIVEEQKAKLDRMIRKYVMA